MRSELGANELGQSAVAVGALAFKQLRRAPDAGKRVLDLMGEHGGEAGHGARGAAMGELPLDHLRHAALLEHDQHAPGRICQRPGVEIDELRRVEPVRAQVDAIFVDGGAVPLHLLDKRYERAAEGDDVAEVAFAKHARAHLEKVLGRGVGVVDPKPLADDEKRMGQRAEQGIRYNRGWLGVAAGARLFGRAAQAVYPCRGLLLS